MTITDDLVHGTILGWGADPGTPAQRVEQALQGWRDKFGGEPQVVLYAPEKGTLVRGPHDDDEDAPDAELIKRQSHIEFRPYPYVGKDEYRIAVKLNVELRPAIESRPLADEVVTVKKRSVKQEAKHQAMVADGMLVKDIVPVVTVAPALEELLPPVPLLDVPLPIVLSQQEDAVEEDDELSLAVRGFVRFARRTVRR